MQKTFALNLWGWGRTLAWRFWVRLEDTLCSYRQPAMNIKQSLPGKLHPTEVQQHPWRLCLLFWKPPPRRGKQTQHWLCYVPSKAVCAWAESAMRSERKFYEQWDRKVFAGGSDRALCEPGNDWGYEVQLEAAVKSSQGSSRSEDIT